MLGLQKWLQYIRCEQARSYLKIACVQTRAFSVSIAIEVSVWIVSPILYLCKDLIDKKAVVLVLVDLRQVGLKVCEELYFEIIAS